MILAINEKAFCDSIKNSSLDSSITMILSLIIMGRVNHMDGLKELLLFLHDEDYIDTDKFNYLNKAYDIDYDNKDDFIFDIDYILGLLIDLYNYEYIVEKIFGLFLHGFIKYGEVNKKYISSILAYEGFKVDELLNINKKEVKTHNKLLKEFKDLFGMNYII